MNPRNKTRVAEHTLGFQEIPAAELAQVEGGAGYNSTPPKNDLLAPAIVRGVLKVLSEHQGNCAK